MYKIIRRYADLNISSETIDDGLTLAQAQKHCSNPQTSSKTATERWAIDHTSDFGPWFDSYELED